MSRDARWAGKGGAARPIRPDWRTHLPGYRRDHDVPWALEAAAREAIERGVGGASQRDLGEASLLPDGKAVVFQSGGTASSARLSLVEIGSGEVVDLGVDGANPRYTDAGYLLFGDKDQALEAVPFDLETHRVTGEPAMVLPDVLVYTGGATQFAVSRNGTAVYARSGGTGQSASELVIVDLEGHGSASPLGPGTYSTPRFSPDGRLLAYVAGGGLWVWNRDSGANARVASDATGPVWSRDGRSIYFGSHAGGRVDWDVFRMNADGSGQPERILDRPGVQVPLSESADASRLLLLDAAPEPTASTCASRP